MLTRKPAQTVEVYTDGYPGEPVGGLRDGTLGERARALAWEVAGFEAALPPFQSPPGGAGVLERDKAGSSGGKAYGPSREGREY